MSYLQPRCSSYVFTVILPFVNRDQEVKVRLWGAKSELIDANSIGDVIIITSTSVRKYGSMSSLKFLHSFCHLMAWYAYKHSYYLNQYAGYSRSSNSATQVYINFPIPETTGVQVPKFQYICFHLKIYIYHFPDEFTQHLFPGI